MDIFANNKRKTILAIIGVIVIFTLIILIVQSRSPSSPTTGASSTYLNSSPDNNTNNLVPERNVNPFVNPDDIEEVTDDFQKTLKKNGEIVSPTPQYNFQYELAPELMNQEQSKNSIFNVIQSVEAAPAISGCNINTIPARVPVYDLQVHWQGTEAGKVAQEFEIFSAPYSRPTQGGTYDYFFTNDYQSGFLKLLESSGVYVYHQVLNQINANISEGDRNDRVQIELTRHHLQNLIGEPVRLNADFALHRFMKPWGNYTVIDNSSITDLSSNSLCDILPAVSINFVEVYMKYDGQLERLINRTRKEIRRRDLPSHSLQAAFTEYSQNPPIKPIIIPANSPTSGTVTFTQGVLVYYDFGEFYPQYAYIPVYLLKGTLSGSAMQVYAMYPAISTAELEKAGLISSSVVSGMEKSQKQGTFSMILARPTEAQPPPPPRPKAASPRVNTIQSLTPTDIPVPSDTPFPNGPTNTPRPTRTPAPTRTPTPTSPMAACPMQAVDYQIRCTQAGQLICTQFTIVNKVVPGANPDPVDVCQKGCKSIVEVFQNTTKKDPCKILLDNHHIPIKNYQDFKKGVAYPDGSMNCTIDACPC